MIRILDRVQHGFSICAEEALELYQRAGLPELALAATWVRNRHNRPRRVSYVIDRNVNYTNVCTIGCQFCAFFKAPRSKSAYRLSLEALQAKAQETLAVGGTGFLLQGGVNPDIPWEAYLEMVRTLTRMGIWVHGFSPVEIQQMSRLSGLSLRETLKNLKDAGLRSLPGGGAEILVDEVRQRISPQKGTVQAWLDVMEAAHEEGMKTTATMMFGVGESLEDRIEHWTVLKEQQERALKRENGGGYTAFIAWPFQSKNTPLEGRFQKPTDVDYLRTMAVARIYLDNVPHMQSSWVTMGRDVGQMALFYGCDDMGSLMLEENVVSAAGTTHAMDHEALLDLIRTAGFEPWQRDAVYGSCR